jgi:alpha-tubulin suppressor-like RCC1 family protein
MVGVLTGTSYIGDGSNLTGIAATNWYVNNVTANSGTTAIDLSNGNTIKFTQTANTTVSFANTGTSNILTFIRANGSGTITWPSSVKWNNGAEPTLTSNPRSSEAQQFMFLTRDEGVTWYGWENFNIDPQNIELWSWGYNNYWGSLGQGSGDHQNRSSPIQLPGTNWNYTGTASENSSFALKSNGELWTWGKNQKGNLGRIPTGETANRSPVKVPGTTWDGAYMGQESIFMSKTDGTLWTAGNNTYGQLGQNNRTQYSSPVQVPGTTWSTIRTFGGRNSFIGTKTNGTLWVFGRNEYGYLGMNNATNYSSPVQVPGTTWTDAIGAGYQTVGVIKTNGTLWMWGRNEYGELGQNSSASPGGTPHPSPLQVGSSTNWSQISGGNGNQIALKTDGTLWVWGTNGRGRLGLNDAPATQYSSPTQIPGTDWNACMTNNDFCIATKTDGTLWAWGANEHGQCSQNDIYDKSSPVQIPGLWTSPLGGSFFHASAFRLVD